ncbi:MAG: maleylpyruvate isomerase family mycothiol-dependent enzyme [Ilumatobacteraceae bacterium]
MRDARGEIEHEVASCVASQLALVEQLAGLPDTDPSLPSRLPGWTVGHVLTHIARNGDSIISLLDGYAQYPHGVAGRNADIEAGAVRPWAALVDDVTVSADAVRRRLLDADDWSGTVSMVGGERPKRLVPQLRQREVEVHRVDLGLGHEFADMPTDYVRRDLRLMETLWTARKPMGMTSIPDAALAVTPAERLSWMMGRSDIADVAPAGLF